ncbi:MAG: hypothetical protein M1370_04165 [Bacteroidetes bacterium]|nr:hypothetical protein [Bacteroidota bacterium]MCL5026701.1 hypothetical protein [Chloroflexota bacterium]
MPSVRVTVVANTLVTYGHCAHCEAMFAQVGVGQAARQSIAEEYPAELTAEYARLWDMLEALASDFGGNVRFELVDPQSLGGVWLSLRHRVRRYPAFIIGGRATVIGWDEGRLRAAIAHSLKGG